MTMKNTENKKKLSKKDLNLIVSLSIVGVLVIVCAIYFLVSLMMFK